MGLNAVIDQPAQGEGQAERRARGQDDEEDAEEGVRRVGLEVGAQRGEGAQVLARHALARRGLEGLFEQVPGAWTSGGGGRKMRAVHAPTQRPSPMMGAQIVT